MNVRVTIWNEYLHEVEEEVVAAIYPQGIHGALASAFSEIAVEGTTFTVRTATLRDPQQGITEDLLNDTDVLIWWGHRAHHEVTDETAALVHRAVLSGMGLVALHSAHESKPVQKILGVQGSLLWREADEKERLWNIRPDHPIMAGLPDFFELEREEMYGERFDIPEPDELLMISWFQGGEVFRSLCTWRRGLGHVVYFRPGHETYPTYFDAHVRRIVVQASAWAAARVRRPVTGSIHAAPLEPVPNPSKEHLIEGKI